MKPFLTLLIIFISWAVNAQIVYTENDGPRVGHQTENKVLESLDGIDLSQLKLAGANRSWNITGEASDFDKIAYVGVSDLSFKSKFPGTNLAQINLPNDDSSYTMLEKNSSGIYWLGFRDTSTTVVFNSKFTLLPFPLSFGKNFQNNVDADFVADTLLFKIEIQTNSNVDGWGIITTNTGSFPALKVRTNQITEITTIGIPIGSSTIESHNWYASGYSNPVATLLYNETESPFGLFNDTTITYLHKEELVANENVQNSNLKLWLSPNPAQNLLNIQVTTDVSFKSGVYEIFNAEGKRLLNGEIKSSDNFPLDVQQIPSGNYFIQLILDKKILLFDIFTKN
ncbi:MAG: T9SS type A sorting domain-containing protein [Saprospiraceae bacterium]